MLLLLGSRLALADPTIDDLASLCASADRVSRGAAAFGCDVVKTMRSEVETDFQAFLEHGCTQAAAVASFEKCSKASDAVKFGYSLQCEEVKKACGCATDTCSEPGKIPFGSYAVVEVGSSCSEPYVVASPPPLAWAMLDIGLGLLIGIGNGATNFKMLESVADPSSKLYEKQREWLLIMMKVDKVPFDKYLVIQLSDGSKSQCLVKRPFGDGYFLWDPMA